jgi:predicted ATPase
LVKPPVNFIETHRDEKWVYGYNVPNYVVCAGTHGGGKTTFVKRMAPKLGLPEITYSRPTAAAQQMGYERSGDVPPEKKGLHQMLSLFEQVAAERTYTDGFFADRGVIDYMAYYLLTVPAYQQEPTYRQMVEFFARRYDLIIYVPPNSKGVESNGIRFERLTSDVDREVLASLNGMGLMGRVLALRTDTPEEREVELLDYLKRVWKAQLPVEKHDAALRQPAP